MNGDSIWIQTYSGKLFRPLDPSPRDVCIEDIAHALALKCRFTGHCREHMSVAQHSVIVSLNVPPEDALWGLMHDAGEAYLPDVAKPYKHLVYFKVDRLWKTFAEVEDAVLEAVATKFEMPIIIPESIKESDRVCLATEARDQMGPPPKEWTYIKGCVPFDWTIVPLPWSMAEKLFLARWRELRTAFACNERNEA